MRCSGLSSSPLSVITANSVASLLSSSGLIASVLTVDRKLIIPLRAKMSETSRPLLITVGRRKIFHLDELEQYAKESLEHRGVGSFAA